MKISDNALNILTAKTYRGIGRAWIVKHLGGNDSLSTIVRILNESAKDGGTIVASDFERIRAQVRDAISKLAGHSDGVVALGDRDFPPYRGNVKNSEQPVCLFYRGDLRLLDKANKSIAVIGLLNPDKSTEALEEEVVAKLVSCGATIVSGLALGCDTVAHRRALRDAGKTVAILPSPLDEILPVANRNLADEIVRTGGLLITEYYEKAKSKMELSGRYQERDRLQALFSDCVLLAASYAKNDLGNDSGARLAMEYATSYSIPQSVLYDPSTDAANPKYDLNRQLIRTVENIVVIGRDNMDSAVGRIVGDRPAAHKEVAHQADLFG